MNRRDAVTFVAPESHGAPTEAEFLARLENAEAEPLLDLDGPGSPEPDADLPRSMSANRSSCRRSVLRKSPAASASGISR